MENTLVIKKKNEKKTDDIFIAILDDEDKYLSTFFEYGVNNIIPILTKNEEGVYSLVRRNCVSGVVIDYKMSPNDGVDVIKKIKKIDPEIPCILMSQGGKDQKIKDFLSKNNVVFFKKSTSDINIKNIRNTLIKNYKKVNVETMAKKIYEFRNRIKEYNEPLINELKGISNQNTLVSVYDYGEVTVAELIEHIELDNEIGKMYTKLWTDTQNTLIRIKKEKFEKSYAITKKKWWKKIFNTK